MGGGGCPLILDFFLSREALHDSPHVLLACPRPQVKVAEELAAATAQISRLQLELTSHQKEEMGLRSQLNNALKEAERHGAQLTHLQAQLAGK